MTWRPRRGSVGSTSNHSKQGLVAGVNLRAETRVRPCSDMPNKQKSLQSEGTARGKAGGSEEKCMNKMDKGASVGERVKGLISQTLYPLPRHPAQPSKAGVAHLAGGLCRPRGRKRHRKEDEGKIPLRLLFFLRQLLALLSLPLWFLLRRNHP